METEYIEKMTRIDERSKSNTKRLDEQDKKIEELEKTYSIMEKMNLRMGNVETSISNINKKLDDEGKVKGKKWDKLIDYIFYCVLGACMVLILTKLGLK